MYMMTNTTDAAIFDLYLTSIDGLSVRHIVSKDEITSLIATALSEYNAVEVVATIAARDALSPTVNTQVMVLDATGDATVTLAQNL